MLRLGLAAVAVAVAVVYILIATQSIHVAETAGKGSPFVPMFGAAVAFLILAALLVLFDKLLIYLTGIALQLVVLIGYFAVAPSRDPHVEVWGIGLKIVQVLMLVVLVYLALKPGARKRTA